MDRDLARRLIEIENIPTLPAIMTRLLDAVEDEGTSAEDLTAILERDMAISARVLRLANSAFYGLRHRVDTIRRAVVVVGFQAVRMLALATSVFDALSRHRQFAFDPEEFWMHSLGTAKAAQLLAKRIPGKESPESCFTAGLLLNIGKYCMALALKEQYAALVRQAEKDGRRLCEVETEALRTTHAEVGQWLAEKWRLPEMFAAVLGNHIRPRQYRGEFQRENSIMGLSAEIAREAGFGRAGDFAPPNLDPAAFALDVPREWVDAARQETAEYAVEARNFLEILKRPE